MSIFDYRYYSQEFMDGLKSYKYNSIDTSPLAKYVMKPWWSTFLHYCIPLNFSANSMTFYGFLIGLSHLCLLSVFDPDVSILNNLTPNSVIPAWVWLYGALAHFLAHTLDGSDGMQARRTGTSSPLGELMDHGLDSISVSIIVLSVPSIFTCQQQFSAGVWELFLLYSVTIIGFYISHWEKYLTGILYLPWTYDASMLLTQCLFLIVFFTNNQLLDFTEAITGLKSSNNFLLTATISVAVFSIPCTARNIYLAYNNKENQAVQRQLTLSNAVRPGIPFIVSMATFVLWHAYSNDDVANQHARLFFYSWSLIFSNITTRLIVSQMCSQLYSPFNALLILPLSAWAVDSYDLLPLDVTMWGLFLLLLALHIHYLTCLVRQFAHYLGVPCLAMPNKRP